MLLSAAAVWLMTIAGAASADPPAQAGRLAFAQGPVSLAPAGDDAWIEAQINRPLTIGDRLWTAGNARAEIELPGAVVRMSDLTSVSLLNLDDRITQLQVAQGRVNVRVRMLPRDETFEVATPNAAFTIERAGDYRIDVDPQAGTTMIAIRDGAGSVYGDGAAFALRRGDAVRFFGTDLSQREFYALASADSFDRWARERDRRFESSYATRYVSPEIVGCGDLDTYGTWRTAASFGNVWFPRDVPQGWAPYRYGHWSWIEPWGWTWVDDAPWGFAPFHYGRWAYVAGSWGWVPGPVRVRPVYAPALVAFVGGANFQIAFRSGPSASGIGWFPLAPGEVYRPAYVASRDYVRNVNVSNTIVNTTVINNVYQNNVTQVNYRNAQVANAVTAVPPTVFAQSQPVQRNAVAVSRDVVMRGQVTPVAAVAPTPMGITGAARATNNRPAPEVLQRSVVARSAPPAPMAVSAQRMEMLQRDPGKPLARPVEARQGVATAAPNVRVVSSATPQMLPPRGREGAEQKVAPPQASAPPPSAAAPAPRAAARDQRERSAAARPANPPPAAPPTAIARSPAAAPPAPAPSAPDAAMESRRGNEGNASRMMRQREAQQAATPPPQARVAPAPQPQHAPQARVAPPPQQKQAPQARVVPAPQARVAPAPQARVAPAPQARVAPAPKPQQVPQARVAPPPQQKQAQQARVAPPLQPQQAPQAAPRPSPQEQMASRQRGQGEPDRGRGEKKERGG